MTRTATDPVSRRARHSDRIAYFVGSHPNATTAEATRAGRIEAKRLGIPFVRSTPAARREAFRRFGLPNVLPIRDRSLFGNLATVYVDDTRHGRPMLVIGPRGAA